MTTRAFLHSTLVALLLTAVSPPAAARPQQGTPGTDPLVRAVAVDPGSLRLDGRLHEQEWLRAGVADGFRQKYPDEGAAAMGGTEVLFLYDEAALWIGARLSAPATGRAAPLRAVLTQHDQAGDAEHLVVFLDTYNDGRTAFAFGVTAAGVRLDWIVEQDEENDVDANFDPVWEAVTRRGPEGWTAEMRIPFSQIRFNAEHTKAWGLNLARFAPVRNESAYWRLVPRDSSGWVSRFGTLVGLQGLSSSRRIEALPYVAVRGTVLGDVDPADPFGRGRELTQRVGMDLKAGLGSSLTLEATFNPDFGQVEADPATVNLTAFETSLSERRPFFAEGRELLLGGGPTYFHSRRIGARPRGPAAGDYVEYPGETTILGAAKLTGRLASGLSLGALAAYTAPEHARVFREDQNGRGGIERVPVEPAAGAAVLRLERELGAGDVGPISAGSGAGLSLTTLARDADHRDPLAGFLGRRAHAGGVDFDLRFGRGTYRMDGYAGFSHVAGDPAAIARLQRAPQRYFQRPDAGHVHFDSTRTHLAGYTARIGLERRAGTHWLWDASVSGRSPGFEINDLGRLFSADEISAHASLTYRDTDLGGASPERLVRSYSGAVTAFGDWTFGGERTFAEAALDSRVEWRNFWRTRSHVHVRPRGLSVTATRGGPAMGTPLDWHLSFSLSARPAQRVGWSVHLDHTGDEVGGRSYRIGGEAAYRPGSWLRLSVEPSYRRSDDARQYVATREGGPPATDGRRFIFAGIERHTYRVEFRAEAAFTPRLTFQLYAQPFAASGRFRDLGELAAPGGLELLRYGVAPGTTIRREPDGAYVIADHGSVFRLQNPDFRQVSLRSNSVLRWEWRPGSTLFAVWQHDRSAFGREDPVLGPHALLDPLSAAGNHSLALKMSYWLPLD